MNDQTGNIKNPSWWLSLLGLLAALLFLGFFNLTKHHPYFSGINLFTEDPFDAVSSFGVILALGSALLGMLGSFRPHENPFTQEDLHQAVNRTGMVLLACLVSLEADFFAFIFHRQVWMPYPAGWWLLGLTVTFYLLCIACGTSLFYLFSGTVKFNWQPVDWGLAVLYLLNGVALAYFPDGWRETIAGAVGAILLGFYFLFFGLHFYGGILLKPLENGYSDVLDDLQAWYAWKKRIFKFAGGLFDRLEVAGRSKTMSGLGQALNPRRHAWRLLMVFGLVAGGGLLLVERLVEGPLKQGMVPVLLAIYLGFMLLEAGMAYALLNSRLGIFRNKDRRNP